MDGYERLGILGRGSFGIAILVQEARHGGSGCHEAHGGRHQERRVIKEIDISRMEAKAQKEALAEVSVLRSLQHVNIIAYVDAFMEANKLYIVMEFADGGDLASAVQDRREEKRHFSEPEVLSMFTQCCMALHHTHTKHVLHRDLKCQNIFLTKNGTVKLGDFGIAKVLDTTAAQAITQIGTPNYLPPEVCDNQPYGTKADMWSLGVVLHEIMALELPFKGSNIAALFWKILTAAPGPLPEQYSPDLRALETHMLQKKPDDRLSAGDLLALPLISYQVALQQCSEMDRSSASKSSTPQGSMLQQYHPLDDRPDDADAYGLASPSSASRPPRLPSKNSCSRRSSDAVDVSPASAECPAGERHGKSLRDIKKQSISGRRNCEQNSCESGHPTVSAHPCGDSEVDHPCPDQSNSACSDAVNKLILKQRRPSFQDAQDVLAAALSATSEAAVASASEHAKPSGDEKRHRCDSEVEQRYPTVDMSDFDVNERVEWSDWGTQTIQGTRGDDDVVPRPSSEMLLDGQNLGSSQHSLFWDTLEARAFDCKQKENEGVASPVERPRADSRDVHGRNHVDINKNISEPSVIEKQRSGQNGIGKQKSDAPRSKHESTYLERLGSGQDRGEHSDIDRSNHKPQPQQGSLPQSDDNVWKNYCPVEGGYATMDMSDFDVNDKIEWADWGTRTLEEVPALSTTKKPNTSIDTPRNQDIGRLQEKSSSPKLSQASLPEWTDWGRQAQDPRTHPSEKPSSTASEIGNEEVAKLQEGGTSPKSSEASLPTREHTIHEHNVNGSGSQHSLFWDTYEAKRFAQVEREDIGASDLTSDNRNPYCDRAKHGEVGTENCRRGYLDKVCTPDPEQLKELSKTMLEQAESELEAKLLGATFGSESDWPLFNLSRCEPAPVRQRGAVAHFGLHKPDETNRSHSMHVVDQDDGKHQERARSSSKAKDYGSLLPPSPPSPRSDLFNTKQRQGLSAMLREVAEDSSPSSCSPSPRRGRQRQLPGSAGSRPPIPKRKSEERSPNRGWHNQNFSVLVAESAKQNHTCSALEGEDPKAFPASPEVFPGDAVELKSPGSGRHYKSMSPRRTVSRSNPNEALDMITPVAKRRPSSKNETRRFNENRQMPSHEMNEDWGSAMAMRTTSKYSAGRQSPSHHKSQQQAQQEQIILQDASALANAMHEERPDIELDTHQYCKPEHLGKTRRRHLSNVPANPHDELEEIACVLRDVLSQVEPEVPIPEQTTARPQPESPAQRLDREHVPRDNNKQRRQSTLRVAELPAKDFGHVSSTDEYRVNLKAAKQIKARMEGGVRNCLAQGAAPVGNETQVGSAKAAMFARQRAQDAKDVDEQMHKQALQQAAAQARRDRQNVMRKMQELEHNNLSGVIQHRDSPVRENHQQLRRGQKI